MGDDVMEAGKVDLDTILVSEIGQFGRFQLRTLALAAVGVVFAAFHAEYVFTTARINTRCLIPECEDASATVFAPPWLSYAVPASGGTFDGCHRFGAVSAAPSADTCPAALFDTGVVVPCDKYVYEHSHTVVYDFELGCDEWRRSLIGFVRSFGTLAALPLTGWVSDRWGRRTALALNAFNTAWLGIARVWAGTYAGFMLSQVVEAVFGSGFFSCTYILVLELVGPKYRVVAGGVLSSCFALGQVALGLLAWLVPGWKALTLALYVPQLLTVGYFWLLSESIRWLMSKGRYQESEALLIEVARFNKKQLSENSLRLLRITAEEEKKRKTLEDTERANEPWLIVLVFKHKRILLRCIILPIWWITMTLVYYGLSINAVNISGNPYVNFMAVAAVEIPGFWISVVLLGKIGRKPVLMAGYWICAACQISYIFMPEGSYGASLSVYMVGKCAISAVTTALYVYTTELYPTRHRHQLFAYSSGVGRIGSILAPLTPAIGAATFAEMPFALFGALALLSGLTLCLTPETLGAALPDTMAEAEHIGSDKLGQKAFPAG